MTFSSEPTKRLTPELLATLLIVLAYIVWLLSLPAWPSQDGPVHLYYTHVFGALLSHQPTVYSRYYTIKHLLPPYALYYYALLALSRFVSLLLADRLIVCIYVVLFVFGFRYLARAVGPGADRAALFATLLVLNWSVGMGFINFCLSLALVFWAMGLWLRFAQKRLLARVGFLLLVVAITLTHPVPLLILLAFCGVDLLQRLALRSKPPAATRAPFAADLATLALASLALIYVKLFTATHLLQQAQSVAEPFLALTLRHLNGAVRLHSLSLIFAPGLPAHFYRAALFLTLPGALLLAIAQRRRNRSARIWSAGDTWLVISVALLVIVPVLPSNISNAYYFSERLTILLWLTALLAASGWSPPPRAAGALSHTGAASGSQPCSMLSVLLLVFAVIANFSLLWSANRVLRPIASQIAAIDHFPPDHQGELAMVLEDARPPRSTSSGPFWNAFAWAPVHLLRHENAVLDNAPWLDSAIIPLGATAALPGAALKTEDSILPHHLSASLRNSPEARAHLLAPIGFVLIAQPGLPAPSALDPALAPAPAAEKQWTCRLAAPGWYQVCTPSTPIAHEGPAIASR